MYTAIYSSLELFVIAREKYLSVVDMTMSCFYNTNQNIFQ